MHKVLGVLQELFFFFSKKQNEEKKNEREKGGGVNFQENTLAFKVGRWALEGWDISHLSHSSQEGHSTANIQNAAACFCNMNFWIVPPANTSRTWVWCDSPGQTDLVFGCVNEMTCGVAVWPYGSSVVLRMRRACFSFQPTVLGCALVQGPSVLSTPAPSAVKRRQNREAAMKWRPGYIHRTYNLLSGIGETRIRNAFFKKKKCLNPTTFERHWVRKGNWDVLFSVLQARMSCGKGTEQSVNS